jgi:phage baseplate assembly protein W
MPNQALEQLRRRERLLGRSFRLAQIVPDFEIGRDLILEPGPNGRDIAWVQSIDNLGQALTIALTTSLGSDVFNVDFGFDGLNAVAEETNAVIMRERIRIAIIRVLQKEPRVRRILDVKLDDGRLEAVTAGQSRTLEVTVSFEAVSGEPMTVNLGRVITNG